MSPKEEESSEKESKNPIKQLSEHLMNSFDLDEGFITALEEGMIDYGEALKDLTER